MSFEEFRRHLLALSESSDPLQECVWEHGAGQVSRWIGRILDDWPQVCGDLTHEDQSAVLWRIGGYPLFIGQWISEDGALTVEDAIALLESAKNVTVSIPQVLPAGEPMETGYFMWWDLLAEHISNPDIATHCLELLNDLLQIEDIRVQSAALHGLGHLDHPDRAAVVDEFIRRHPEAGDDVWVLQCRNGTVM